MPNTESARHTSSSAPPQFLLNGLPQTWLPGLTLAELLAQRGEAAEAVATAINGQFIPRRLRAQTQLQVGDSLTIFEAITGG